MTLALNSTIRNAMVNAIRDQIDAGTGAGKLSIYSGTRPASGGATTTKLAELVMSDPAGGDASAGVLTLDAITDDASADASGTATWFRITDSDDNFCVDGNVGTSGSDLNLNSTSLVSGGIVSISSFTVTAPNP